MAQRITDAGVRDCPYDVVAVVRISILRQIRSKSALAIKVLLPKDERAKMSAQTVPTIGALSSVVINDICLDLTRTRDRLFGNSLLVFGSGD
jgi:hypothetical protein